MAMVRMLGLGVLVALAGGPGPRPPEPAQPPALAGRPGQEAKVPAVVRLPGGPPVIWCFWSGLPLQRPLQCGDAVKPPWSPLPDAL